VALTVLPSITPWHPVPPLLTMSWTFLPLLHMERESKTPQHQ
jgi:hypothetical protein